MRRLVRPATVALALSLLSVPVRAQVIERLQYPLAPSKLMLKGEAVRFKAEWSGPHGATINPKAVASTLAIGDTRIPLDATRWKVLPRNKGYKYVDRRGIVRSILLRVRRNGGSVKIKGGVDWTEPPASVAIVLAVGTTRWCAAFDGPFVPAQKGMVVKSDTAPATCPCADNIASTWQAIQEGIIERYGCTAAACHGAAPNPSSNGGLDLRPDVAYRNLVGVASTRLPDLERVKRADRTHSLFWLKLALKAAPDDYAEIAQRLGITSTAGSGMPLNELTLSRDELEAIRLWIQSGAPETGVVNGTAELLSTCLPPPDPIKITPPPAPAAEDGIQLHAPPWAIPPRNAQGQNGEDEVCYSTRFDVSAQVPASVRIDKDDPRCRFWSGRCSNDRGTHCTTDGECGPGGTCHGEVDCFYFNRDELTMDPNSHHSIIHIYRGQYAPGSPEYTRGFGPFTCNGGANDGQACDPAGAPDQCPDGICTGRVQRAVACIGYGPPDYGFSITGSGSNNAPSIGGSQQPYTDQTYAPGVYGIYPVSGTVVWNSHAFNVTDRPTTNEQYFNVYFAKTPADRQSFIRGIFDTRFIFVQDVPPYEKREYCATYTLPQGALLTQLSSHTHKRGVLFRIWMPPNAQCNPGPSCRPEDGRTPLVATTIYNDPIQYDFDTPVALDDADVRTRTIKYCTVYDNGFRAAAEVKRRSTSPPPPFFLAPGGPCGDDTVACVGGPHKGELCHGSNAACDSAPGAGDGVCDACPLRGGVTTEDEMFILLGNWYVPGQ